MSSGQELHISADGSHTLFSPQFKAYYHSVYGAADESVHVFVIAGLYHMVRQGRKEISVFEMGFGTGLNALLFMLESQKFEIKIHYHSIESTPVSSDILETLNYSEYLNCDHLAFKRIHEAAWNQEVKLSEHFTLHKQAIDIRDLEFEKNMDLVLWDAFAPNCQSFLWEEDIHKRLYKSLATNACLVSYCSKGSFRRMLKGLGYRIERLNGPGKKREMIRAFKASVAAEG